MGRKGTKDKNLRNYENIGNWILQKYWEILNRNLDKNIDEMKIDQKS